MENIKYFNLKAKNLYKDFKNGTPQKHFSIDYRRVVNDLYEEEIDADNFTLMKAQHIIALMFGFDKWSDLLKTPQEELDRRKALFEKDFPKTYSEKKALSNNKLELECLHCGNKFFEGSEKHASDCDGHFWDIIPAYKE